MTYNDNLDHTHDLEEESNFYQDTFGENIDSFNGERRDSMDATGSDDMATDATTDEMSPLTTPSGMTEGEDAFASDFNETLDPARNPHIQDQLDDESLQREAETDYSGGSNDQSLGDKIKDKYRDMTS